MKPLTKSEIAPEEMERAYRAHLVAYRQGDPVLAEAFGVNHPNIEKELMDFFLAMWQEEEVWINDQYQVHKRTAENGMIHLSIRRRDRRPCKDWRDFQAIKNQLVGPECEAVELYPAESRVVDTANQYHLWASTDPKFRFPCGFDCGFRSESEVGGSKQRPFESA